MYRPDLKPYLLPVKPRTGTKRKLTGSAEPESKEPHLSRKRKQSLNLGEPPYTSSLEVKKPKQNTSSNKCKQKKSNKPKRTNPPPLPALVSPVGDLILTGVQPSHIPVDRPLPPDEWKRRSMQVLCEHSQMQIIDCLCNPNSERELHCREIAPHTRLCVGADGNCLFRAFSRQLTGTEGNHEAIRQALVACLCLHPDYIQMERPPGDREVPTDDVQRYVFWRQHVDSYLEERDGDERYGRWGTDFDIYLLADMLNVNVLIFTTFHNERKWVQYGPGLGLERIGQYALYLYHTVHLNHYDCVVPHV